MKDLYAHMGIRHRQRAFRFYRGAVGANFQRQKYNDLESEFEAGLFQGCSAEIAPYR